MLILICLLIDGDKTLYYGNAHYCNFRGGAGDPEVVSIIAYLVLTNYTYPNIVSKQYITTSKLV